MHTIDKDKYGHLTHDAAKKSLRMQWLPATIDMTADDLKHSITVIADAVVAHGIESLVVNTRDFHPNPALMEMAAWRKQNIVPKYNKSLKRFAWLAEAQVPQLPDGGKIVQGEGEAYQSCWFRDEAEAIAWATANG